MTFVSFHFYIFLAIVVVTYYIVPLKVRWLVLLIGSIYFYCDLSSFSITKISALIGTALLCWLFGILQINLSRYKKVWLVLSVLVTVVPLLAIKEMSYVDHVTSRGTPIEWIVPVGIAFYSMQLIAYSVDVYKGKIAPEKDPLRFLLFVSFFPQIIQGPIPRYDRLQPQLVEGHRFDERGFVKGFMLILWGFFLKLCIADKAAVIVDKVFDAYPTYGGFYILVAGILYSLQLYADFLAYTTFAQGMSSMLGIELADNFDHPYFSQSIKDFWRRWHISLSSWLKDYIYIPLGGNRKGRIHRYIFLVITFAVSGIWHGPGYKFLFWGLLHAGYQIAGELLISFKDMLDKVLLLDEHPTVKRILKTTCTFIMVMMAWIIFRADRLRIALSMIGSMFTIHNVWILTDDSLLGLGLGWKECILLVFCLVILSMVSFWQEKGVQVREKILGFGLPLRWMIYIGAMIFVMLFGTYGYGFDTQSFIYGGF